MDSFQPLGQGQYLNKYSIRDLKNSKTKQNYPGSVASYDIGQETRRAYSTTLLSPHKTEFELRLVSSTWKAHKRGEVNM